MNDGHRRNTPEEILEVVNGHLAGKSIEFRNIESTYGWDTPTAISWDFSRIQYRIKPAKTKRAKLCCFVYKDGQAMWCLEGSTSMPQNPDPNFWTRRPEFDMEAGVAR